MNCIEQIIESTYKECFQDYVGLWEIVARVETDCGINDVGLRLSKTLEVLQGVLKFPDIGVGQFYDGRSFEFWNLSSEDALKRIASEWDVLGHEPNLGDIAWLTSRKEIL